ncbi:MAG: DUF4468 domain-containing protein [Dyadobacter sp.]
MKYTILIVLTFLCQQAFSQDGLLPLDGEKNIQYSDLGKPELGKAEIYKKAQEWVSKTFGNYENAVTGSNQESGKLLITSYVPVSHSLYEYLRFDLSIDCQDHQYVAKISKLDGVSTMRSPARLGPRENDIITAKEILVKTETARKKKSAEEALQVAKADNESINNTMYNLLGSLKVSITSKDGQ